MKNIIIVSKILYSAQNAHKCLKITRKAAEIVENLQNAKMFANWWESKTIKLAKQLANNLMVSKLWERVQITVKLLLSLSFGAFFTFHVYTGVSLLGRPDNEFQFGGTRYWAVLVIGP